MYKNIRRVIFIITSIFIIFILISCNNPKEKEEPIKIPKEDTEEIVDTLSKEEQDEIMNEYYQLLTKKSNIEDIVDFIDENIEKVDKENAEIMVISLDDFLSSRRISMEEDYALLSKYKAYVSMEMKSYLNLLEKETSNSFTDGEKLNLKLEEILDRGLAAEKHLQNFPKGKKTDIIYDLYREYIKASIVGMGNQYIFAEEGSSTIKKEYLDTYKIFMENNKDTKTANILLQYIDLLEKNQNNMNSEEIIKFYDDLELVIREQF